MRSASNDANAKYKAQKSKATKNASAKRKDRVSEATENVSAKPEGTKLPSQRAGMSAANIVSSDILSMHSFISKELINQPIKYSHSVTGALCKQKQ